MIDFLKHKRSQLCQRSMSLSAPETSSVKTVGASSKQIGAMSNGALRARLHTSKSMGVGPVQNGEFPRIGCASARCVELDSSPHVVMPCTAPSTERRSTVSMLIVHGLNERNNQASAKVLTHGNNADTSARCASRPSTQRLETLSSVQTVLGLLLRRGQSSTRKSVLILEPAQTVVDQCMAALPKGAETVIANSWQPEQGRTTQHGRADGLTKRDTFKSELRTRTANAATKWNTSLCGNRLMDLYPLNGTYTTSTEPRTTTVQRIWRGCPNSITIATEDTHITRPVSVSLRTERRNVMKESRISKNNSVQRASTLTKVCIP